MPEAFRGPVRLMILLAVGGATRPLLAQDEPRTSPAPVVVNNRSLAALVKDLDSEDARTRVGATEILQQSGSVPLRQLEEVLRTSPLSLEQRERLLGVAGRRFRSPNEPHAAMGIRYDGNIASHGVVLAFVQPDFPCAQVLRVGDRVIAAGSFTIDGWDTMRAVIVSHDPGDEIPITVVREGATLNLMLTLGDYGVLKQPTGIEPSVLTEAWRLRTRGFDTTRQAKAAPIESGLPAAAWSQQFNQPPNDGEVPALSGRPAAELLDQGRVGLVAGGEARGGTAPRLAVIQRAFTFRAMPGEGLGQQPAILQPADPQGQIQALRARVTDLQLQLDQAKAKLADPKTPDDQKRMFRAMAEALDAQIQMQNEMIRQWQARMTPRPKH